MPNGKKFRKQDRTGMGTHRNREGGEREGSRGSTESNRRGELIKKLEKHAEETTNTNVDESWSLILGRAKRMKETKRKVYDKSQLVAAVKKSTKGAGLKLVNFLGRPQVWLRGWNRRKRK